MNADNSQNATMPTFTKADFLTPAPFNWVYGFHADPFKMEQMRTAVGEMAKELGLRNFATLWNLFIRSKTGKNVSDADRATQFPDQPMQLNCGQYRCDEDGVALIDKYGDETTIITHPIMPVMRIQNIETREERVKLAYRFGSEWHTITVPNGVIANAQKIISLADIGLGVTTENARELVKYLSLVKDKNRDTIPFQRATSHLGWQVDGTFSPFGEGVSYDGDNIEYQRIFESVVKPCGDRDTWMEIARSVRTGGSVPARIALAASFAAPLIHVVGGLPFFVHFWGAPGCGKTVGLMLAASVWGNPNSGEFMKSFSSTKVALEGMASFCANVPVIFDELQVIGDRQQFDDLIYMLCEGVSKSRGTKDGGLQIQKRWNTTILTSGEMPIVQANSGGGAAVRTIEVNYGGKKMFEDGHVVSEVLRSNYGFAGREFIKALKNTEITDQLNDVREQYRAAIAKSIDDKQVLSASILLTADWIASKAIFHDSHNLKPSDIMPYLVSKTKADKQLRCYEWLMGFVAANDARFHTQEHNEQWGIIENGVVYIIRSVFDNQMNRAGFNPGAFLNWAKRSKVIECEEYGDTSRTTVRKTINGSRVTCIALIRREDGSDPTEPSGFVEVDAGDELPFL